MSAPPGHRGKRLLVSGVIAMAIGAVGFFTEAMFTDLLVPVCQSSARWIRAEECAAHSHRLLALELVLGFGVMLLLLDLAMRTRSRWRAR